MWKIHNFLFFNNENEFLNLTPKNILFSSSISSGGVEENFNLMHSDDKAVLGADEVKNIQISFI